MWGLSWTDLVLLRCLSQELSYNPSTPAVSFRWRINLLERTTQRVEPYIHSLSQSYIIEPFIADAKN
jgi:hypothetical protein